jgi:hypothetical protein
VKTQIRTLCVEGEEIPGVIIELHERGNLVMVGPGHGRYIKPPLTFWGRFLNLNAATFGMAGRGILLKEPRVTWGRLGIEIHFIGEYFLDVETYDVLEAAGVEFYIDGQAPPEIPNPGTKTITAEEPVTVDKLKKQLSGGKNGKKRKFNAEGGIVG